MRKVSVTLEELGPCKSGSGSKKYQKFLDLSTGKEALVFSNRVEGKRFCNLIGQYLRRHPDLPFKPVTRTRDGKFYIFKMKKE
jgi:hypothetical protein